METRAPKNKTAALLIIVILTVIGQQVHAAEYQTFYLDSLNSGDNIVYCLGNDSIKFVANEGAVDYFFFFNGYQDTVYNKALILPNGFEGEVNYQGPGKFYSFYVYPFRADAIGDRTIVCGGTAQLNVTSNYTGTGTLTYAWSPASGLDNSTVKNPKATVTENTAYTITVTHPFGCEAEDVVNVIVNPFIADAGTDKTIICGGTAHLDGVTSNYTGTGTLTYAWTPASGLDNPDIMDPKATVTENTAYSVTVLTPNGCQSEDAINIIVDPFIVDAGADKTIICGGTAQLDAVTSNYTGTGTLTYAWTPATGLDNPAIVNPKATVTEYTAYSVSVSTPNGCQSEDGITVFMQPMNNPAICMVGVDENNKNIVVWNEQVSASIDSFYIFKESNITDVYQKIGAVAYGDISMFVDPSSRPEIQSNKYKISIYDACGLESDKSPFHKTMHLSINQGQNNVWNLIWESYQGFAVSTYNIYRGTRHDNLQLIGTSPASNTQYSDFSAPAGYVYYQIEIISPGACNPQKKSAAVPGAEAYNSSRSNIATNNPSGINEKLTDHMGIVIYPNPVDNEITIEFRQPGSRQRIVAIIDMNGQIVKREALHIDKTILDIGTLTSGMYIIHVMTDEGVITQKLIKQ